MEEIIERFDKTFGTDTLKNIDINNMPILSTIFKEFGENLYIFDEAYEKLRKQKIDVENKLVQTFSREEDKLYNELWDIDNRMVAQREQQMFMYGYLIATHLNKETKK